MLAALYARLCRPAAAAPGQGDERPKRPLEDLSDAEIQQRALNSANEREAMVTEALFRTRDTLIRSQKTTNCLTWVIAILTVVMAWQGIVAVWHWLTGGRL